MKIEIANLAALALASSECQKNWENTVTELLKDARQLTSSVEAAMIDGLSGNYKCKLQLLESQVRWQRLKRVSKAALK